MIRFFRNPEIIWSAALSLFLIAVCSSVGFWFQAAFGILLLTEGILLLFLYLAFTFRRYRKLQALSRDLDLMLHGQTCVSFDAYREGELSILENELSKLTLRLNEQAETLLTDKKYLADSLADISHQLRSPLTSIHLILTMLKEPGLSEERRHKLLYELTQLISRIDWLVEALLKISKMDAKTVQFSQTHIEAAQLIEAASSTLLIPMELRGQNFNVHLAEGFEGFTGDFSWCTEALLNLLKNCMEHTPEGGTIEVLCQENTIFTEIIVQDNGPGFDREDLPHIFERFYRGKNATDQSIGIGLALSRMIVCQQNGTIKAENRPEGGARFIVKFYKK